MPLTCVRLVENNVLARHSRQRVERHVDEPASQSFVASIELRDAFLYHRHPVQSTDEVREGGERERERKEVRNKNEMKT